MLKQEFNAGFSVQKRLLMLVEHLLLKDVE